MSVWLLRIVAESRSWVLLDSNLFLSKAAETCTIILIWVTGWVLVAKVESHRGAAACCKESQMLRLESILTEEAMRWKGWNETLGAGNLWAGKIPEPMGLWGEIFPKCDVKVWGKGQWKCIRSFMQWTRLCVSERVPPPASSVEWCSS